MEIMNRDEFCFILYLAALISLVFWFGAEVGAYYERWNFAQEIARRSLAQSARRRANKEDTVGDATQGEAQ